MAKHTLDEIKALVAANNRSRFVSNAALVCLIWKESGFDDAAHARHSTATGLMQMTLGAVKDVNNATPPGTHYSVADLTDAAKNIQCGSLYIDLRIERDGGALRQGLDAFGTGPGYADNILACEACLAPLWTSGTDETSMPCLFGIHH